MMKTLEAVLDKSNKFLEAGRGGRCWTRVMNEFMKTKEAGVGQE